MNENENVITFEPVKPGTIRLFYTDGRIVEKQERATLEGVRKLLGIQWCEVLGLDPGANQVFIFDEEGRMNGSKPNRIASLIMASARPGIGTLFGNVAQINDEDFKDDDE